MIILVFMIIMIIGMIMISMIIMMTRLVWSQECADMAQRAADQCTGRAFTTRTCRSFPFFVILIYHICKIFLNFVMMICRWFLHFVILISESFFWLTIARLFSNFSILTYSHKFFQCNLSLAFVSRSHKIKPGKKIVCCIQGPSGRHGQNGFMGFGGPYSAKQVVQVVFTLF